MAAEPVLQIDIAEIIEQGAIETHFQPITSIRKNAVIGVEALSRGIAPDGSLIPPAALFEMAAQAGLTLELDRLCRDKAVETFRPLLANNPELILFVNFQASTANQSGFGANSLLKVVNAWNLDPRNVAIEIVESEFVDSARLQTLVQNYKRSGFLVLIDDIGVGYSNLDRIITVQPDILKADRSLVQEMHRDFYKREVFQALVKLSEKIGGWVIAEGIEEQEDAITALSMGADMLQGFYFARPYKVDGSTALQFNAAHVQDTAAKFRTHKLEETKRLRLQKESRKETVRQFVTHLQGVASEDFEGSLAALMLSHPIVESVCMLDIWGIQITETVWRPAKSKQERTIIFRPPSLGTDHSSKEHYYLLIGTGIDPFETDPYVPLPTEQLCITISTCFKDVKGTPFILCLHMNALEQEMGWK
jgi:EAL domain-containing protein (putative c-di-GMP-specific phosphodiesterase class I)